MKTRTDLHLFHFNTNALDLSEHVQQIVKSVKYLSFLVQEFHEVAPLVQNLLLPATYKTRRWTLDAPAVTWMPSFATSKACCNLDF